MIAAPLGDNQLRPAMSLDPSGITLRATVGNPFGAGNAMYFPSGGTTAPTVYGTNQPVAGGGYNFDTSNWTMETWVYASAYSPSPSYYQFLMEITHGGPDISLRNTGALTVAQSFVTELFTTAATLPLNQWNHIAQVRNGNTLTLYMNGVSVGSANVAGRSYTQLGTGYSTAYVGGGYNSSTLNVWIGYQCESRISSIARYTANFTRPTSPFVDDQYTLLLVHGGTVGTAISDDNT